MNPDITGKVVMDGRFIVDMYHELGPEGFGAIVEIIESQLARVEKPNDD